MGAWSGAYRIDSHLDHVIDILFDLVGGECRAHIGTILIVDNAMQLHGTSVEFETALRIDREGAQPHRNTQGVTREVTVRKFDNYIIKVGVLDSIP